MIAAVAIGAAGLLGVALTALVYFAISSRTNSANVQTALAAMIAAGKAQIAAQSELLGVETQRDDALAKAAKAEAELADVLKKLAAVERQRNDCDAKEETADADAIRNAPDARAALDVFNGVQPHMPAAGAGDSGKATSADHGDAGEDTVRPAPAAEGVPDGRLP